MAAAPSLSKTTMGNTLRLTDDCKSGKYVQERQRYLDQSRTQRQIEKEQSRAAKAAIATRKAQELDFLRLRVHSCPRCSCRKATGRPSATDWFAPVHWACGCDNTMKASRAKDFALWKKKNVKPGVTAKRLEPLLK